MAFIVNTTTQKSWLNSFRLIFPLFTNPFSEWRIRKDLQRTVKEEMLALSIQTVFLARISELQSTARSGELSGRPRSKRLDHKATGARRPGGEETSRPAGRRV